MTGCWRRGCRVALALAIVGGAAPAVGQDSRVMTPDAAYREMARSGELRAVRIAGDLDVSRLHGPVAGARLVLQHVDVEGRVHASGGGPAAPLELRGGALRRIELAGVRFPAVLEIDDVVVQGPARFADAQFDASFVLHRVRLRGGAIFRRARFNGPVEIVATEFEAPAGAVATVSFADTRFAAPARFDRSRFAGGVHFDAARFDADVTFLRLVAPGRASWLNATFARDAEFRFCTLGDADFGDREQMAVFAGLADFRGCTMRSARLDYVDARGDVMLVNVHVAPGDLTLRHAALRGGRADLSGVRVEGRLDLEGAHISALHVRWPEVAGPLRRAPASSAVLRALHHRLEALGQKDDALAASAALAERVFCERVASPDVGASDKAGLWLEWIAWGWPTGYGTRLGRIVSLAVAAWLALSLPLLGLVWPRTRLGYWRGPLGEAPPRHRPAPAETLTIDHVSPIEGAARLLAYTFGVMFATPGLRWRPEAQLSAVVQGHLLAMRAVGAVLLALLALTLANVSPIFQAILGKIVG